MNNKAIVLCLVNIVLTISKFSHSDYKTILKDWVQKSSRLYVALPKRTDSHKAKTCQKGFHCLLNSLCCSITMHIFYDLKS